MIAVPLAVAAIVSSSTSQQQPQAEGIASQRKPLDRTLRLLGMSGSSHRHRHHDGASTGSGGSSLLSRGVGEHAGGHHGEGGEHRSRLQVEAGNHDDALRLPVLQAPGMRPVGSEQRTGAPLPLVAGAASGPGSGSLSEHQPQAEVGGGRLEWGSDTQPQAASQAASASGGAVAGTGTGSTSVSPSHGASFGGTTSSLTSRASWSEEVRGMDGSYQTSRHCLEL